MTKNYFNAKKVLMSTLAAAVFSFVFATSANASNPNDVKINGTEIRQYPENNDPQDPQTLPEIIIYILQTVFGVRV
jgi:hypothetical protein